MTFDAVLGNQSYSFYAQAHSSWRASLTQGGTCCDRSGHNGGHSGTREAHGLHYVPHSAGECFFFF